MKKLNEFKTKEDYKEFIKNIAEVELLIEDIQKTLRKDINKEKEKLRKSNSYS